MFDKMYAALFAFAGTACMFWFAVPLLWRAIASGQIPTRKAVYTRKDNPAQFYLVIVFWIFMMGLVLLGSAAMIDILVSG